MRVAWVDASNDADWAKAAAHKLTGLFYPLCDPPAVVKARLLDTKARGYSGGVYVVHNSEPQWAQFALSDPRDFASVVAVAIGQVVNTVGPSWPKVQFDLEAKDPDWISAALERWRELRPNQDTSWTMEAGQGGWMDQEFVADILSYKVRLVPQLYNGSMTEVWDSLAYARDLTKAGFPDALISPFYDAAHLPHGYDGFVFTLSRLP